MPGKIIRLPGRKGMYYRRKSAKKDCVMAKDPRYKNTPGLKNKKFRFQRYRPERDEKVKYPHMRNGRLIRAKGYKKGYAHTQDKGTRGF